MQLLYVYLKDFQAIKNVGFDFGGTSYRFRYDEQLKTLEVKDNPLYLQGFFSSLEHKKKSIVNISAVIGKNGTGKTSLLNFLKDNLCYGVGGIKYAGIYIFKIGGFDPIVQDDSAETIEYNDKEQYLVYHHRTLPIKLDSESDFGQKVKITAYSERTEVKGALTIYEEQPGSDEISYIFFSNTLDRQREQRLGNLFNISTNYLVRYDQLTMNNMDNNFAGYNPGAVNDEVSNVLLTNSLVDAVSAYTANELKRQIQFLASKYSKLLPFSMELKLSISFDRTQETITLKYLKENTKLAEKLKFLIEAIDSVLQYFDSKLRSAEEDEQKAIVNFYRALFVGIVNNFARFDLYPLNVTTLESLTSHEPRDYVISLLKYIGTQINEKTDFTDKALIPFMDEIETLIKGKPVFKDGFYNRFYVDLKEENLRKEFYKFANVAAKASPYNSFLNFDWIGAPSSGEEGILNMFSRFYQVKTEDIRESLKKHILILIDEGELYLHPRWQKQFVRLLTDYLPQLFDQAETIQIILTSHSPFIVSDLPQTNIVFLNKNYKENKVMVSELELHKQTFASNIHSLFTEGFFMEDGLIGDFAEIKINEVISVLLDSTPAIVYKKRDYLERMIGLIGEPVIKAKLLSMLEDILKTNLINMRKEMDDVQRRLKKLENK